MSAKANRNPNAGPGEPGDDGPLKLLDGPLGAGQSLQYPRNITKVDHYMVFSAYEEHAFQASTVNRQNKNKLGSVYLPMPSGLTTAYEQSYENSAMGAIGAELAGAASNQGSAIREQAASGDVLGVGKSLSKIGFEAGKKLANPAALGNLLSGGTGAALAGGGVGGLANKFERTSGVAGGLAAGAAAGVQQGLKIAGAGVGITRNPHMAVLYTSPNFRQFEFGFELKPKSYHESIDIGKIIHFFKYYSAPEYLAQNHFFDYPNQFKVYFKHPDFLFKMGDMVLKNVAIDYHGEGTPLYYDASAAQSSGRKLLAPASVKMQLTFQEIKVLTKTEIEKQGR